MRSAHLIMIAAAMVSLAGAGSAQAQNGLSAVGQNMVWPQWQSRVALGLTQTFGGSDGPSSNAQLSSFSLLGDYYFHRNNPTRAFASGFRATSGMLLGSTSPRLLSGWSGGLSSPGRFNLSRQSLGADNAMAGSAREDDPTPYIGLGYTSISLSGGWGFSADIGLSSTLKGRSNGLWGRAGGAPNSSANFDDALRDMRLAPLLHLGVTYSF